MKTIIFSFIIVLCLSCESSGEYRIRITKVACDCAVSNDLGEKREYPHPDSINAFTREKRALLLRSEQPTINAISNCMSGRKLPSKDIRFFWNNYDVYKVRECQTEQFHNFYRYVYQLKHGSF